MCDQHISEGSDEERPYFQDTLAVTIFSESIKVEVTLSVHLPPVLVAVIAPAVRVEIFVFW